MTAIRVDSGILLTAANDTQVKKMEDQPRIEQPTEDEYLNCIRCGLCLSVCPTYREYLNEASSPRGRIALARKGLEGELDLSRNLMAQMYACFDCQACAAVCPVGLHPSELMLKMRHVQEQRKPAFWKKPLFGGLMAHAGRMEAATWPFRVYQNLGIRSLVRALHLTSLLPRQIRDMEAMLPHQPKRPLRRTLPEVSPAIGEECRRVGFFLGCIQSLMFSEQSAAAITVLRRNGCTVITPPEVTCCGMPALGYGQLDLVREQAKQNIALFEEAGVDTVITDCATCGSTLKDYGEHLRDDPEWAERAAAFSVKVRDVSEFLGEIPLEKPKGKLKGIVTYHDPCHLRRGQGVWTQPREILQGIDGLIYVEMEEADWCCGSAGTQLITHYQTSRKVMDRKIDHLAETGAQIVASGCPGCQMQLNAGVRAHKLDVRIVHPVTLLAEAYEAENE
jgi:glycolate oxidase iron-sulfur subunit